MVFFKKKKKEEPASTPVKKEEKKIVSLQAISHERVLTAEGWRRQMQQKTAKPSKK